MKKYFAVFLVLVLSLAAAAGLADDSDPVRVRVELTYEYEMAESMIDLINEFRTGKDAWYYNDDTKTEKTDLTGQLGTLVYDYGLEKAAMQRAAECAVQYGHTRPNGESCFTVYPNYGYTAMGENIAAGYTTTESVFEAWQETNYGYSGQGHRRNMLNENITHIGIGCVCADGTYYWCQVLEGMGTGESRTVLSGPAIVDAVIGRLVINKAGERIGMSGLSTTPAILKIDEGTDADIPEVNGRSAGWGNTMVTVLDVPWVSDNTGVVTVSEGRVQAVNGGRTTLSINLREDPMDNLTVDVVSVCKEHTWDEGTVTLEPKCTEKGTMLYTCSVCGETRTEEIGELDHDWGDPVYTWADGHTAITAVRTCKRDGAHQESENGTITDTVTLAPTCTEKGSELFAATFVNEAFTPQSETVELKELGHKWTVSYHWAADHLSVDAHADCENDPAHTLDETAAAKRVVTLSPAEDTPGTSEWVSENFERPEFSAQRLEADGIPALGDMQTVRLPDDLKEIGEEAFAGNGMEAVVIPDGCTAIGAGAFANCRSLIYVRIPESVETVAEDAFAGCPAVLLDRIN